MAPCDAHTKLLESNHAVEMVIYENLTQKVMPLFYASSLHKLKFNVSVV